MFSHPRLIPLQPIYFYPAYTPLQTQGGPTCYYHAYLHLLAIHQLPQEPLFVTEMMRTIESLSEDAPTEAEDVIYETILTHADNLLWIADEMATNNDRMESDDMASSDDDWAQDFVDEYGREASVAKLMNLQLCNLNTNKLTLSELIDILSKFGPVATGMERSSDLSSLDELDRQVYVGSGGVSRQLINVDDREYRGCHYVMVIGADPNKQRVYIIDPNYPEYIFSMNFNIFKSNLTTGEYVTVKQKTIAPQLVIITEERGINDLSGIQTRTLSY